MAYVITNQPLLICHSEQRKKQTGREDHGAE
jgi:hypothetical protein